MNEDKYYFKDWIDYINNELGNEPWITIYKCNVEKTEDSEKSEGIYSALISKEDIKKMLDHTDWDLCWDQGMPGFITNYEDGKSITKYQSNSSNCEPLVRLRSFHGVKNNYPEMAEEIILFHNLYNDRENNRYVSVDEGEEIEVIKYSDSEIKIKRRFLLDFITAKQLDLMIFYDITILSNIENISDINWLQFEADIKTENLRYNRGANEFDSSMGFNSFGYLMGKKLIACGAFNKLKQINLPIKEYQNFIINEDEAGNPTYFPSNPNKLRNNFVQNNLDSPHYLTPVFFKRDVLSKYYNNPSLYQVDDNHLSCCGVWSLRIDNNHSEYIVVYLGDLGRDLPEKEQIYWKSYNVLPDGTISETYFKRSMLAEFTQPSSEDLIFKNKFITFQSRWLKKFKWNLFLPLLSNDEHNFQSLRVLMKNEQAEFDTQILSLCKVLVDSLNVEGIKKNINKFNDEKGIGLFNIFLNENNHPDTQHIIGFLRNLYNVRSTGVGHRKGKSYKTAIERLEVKPSNFMSSFKNVLATTNQILDQLSNHFLEKR